MLVLEQHDVAGGCTHTFEDRGFEFDTGLHYIGGRIWEKGRGNRVLLDRLSTGRAVHWAKMDEVVVFRLSIMLSLSSLLLYLEFPPCTCIVRVNHQEIQRKYLHF